MKWFEFAAAVLFILVAGYLFLVDFEEFWYGRQSRDVVEAVAAYTDESLVPEWAVEMFEAIDRLPETAGTEA